MKTCWFIIIESLGAFWVDCEGKAYGPFDSSEAAASAARRIAITYGDADRRSQIYTRVSGAQRLIWSGPEPAG